MEGLRQGSQSSDRFYSYHAESRGRKKPTPMSGQFSKVIFFFVSWVIWLLQSASFGVRGNARISALPVTLSVCFMLIPDRLGDKLLTYLLLTYFFIQKGPRRVE